MTVKADEDLVPTPYQNSYNNDLDDVVETPPANPDTPPAPEPEPEPENPEEKTFKQRYGDLRRLRDKELRELRKEIEDLKGQVNAKPKDAKLPKTKEEIDAWRNEHPDVYDIVATIATEKARTEQAEISKRLETIQQRENELAHERAYAQLVKIHPDFEELRVSEEFHDWVKEQPKQIQEWLYDNEDDFVLAARAVDLYKAEKGLNKKKRQDKKVETAAPVNPGANAPAPSDNKKVWKLSEIDKLHPRDFEKHEAEISKAQREGRIINDIN